MSTPLPLPALRRGQRFLKAGHIYRTFKGDIVGPVFPDHIAGLSVFTAGRHFWTADGLDPGTDGAWDIVEEVHFEELTHEQQKALGYR